MFNETFPKSIGIHYKVYCLWENLQNPKIEVLLAAWEYTRGSDFSSQVACRYRRWWRSTLPTRASTPDPTPKWLPLLRRCSTTTETPASPTLRGPASSRAVHGPPCWVHRHRKSAWRVASTQDAVPAARASPLTTMLVCRRK